MIKQIIRNLLSNWMGLVVSVVVSFFLAPFVVSKLGNTYYGIWALVGQFSGYLYLFDFGIRESIIRYVARYKAKQLEGELSDVIQTSFYVYLLIAFASFVLLAVLGYFFTDIFGLEDKYQVEVAITVLLIGGVVAQTFIFNVFNGVMMGFQRYDIFNLLNILGTTIRASLFVFLLSEGYGIVALAVTQFLISLGTGLILTAKAVGIARASGIEIGFSFPGWKTVKETQRKIISYGIFVLVNNLGQKIIFMSDAIVIGLFLPVSQVTFYVIASTLVDYMRKLLMASAQMFNPLISHLSALNQDDSVRYSFVASTKLLLFIGMPIGVIFVILGSEFIGYWMGPEYAVLSGQVLAILAVAQVASAPHQAVSSVLLGLNKHRALAYFRVAEAASNLLLSIVLIQHIGIVGVAVGTAVPHLILVLFVLPRYACRQVGIPLTSYFYQGYFRPAIVGVILLSLSLVAKEYVHTSSMPELMALIAVLSAVYATVSWFIVLTTSEREFLLRQIAGRMRSA